MNAAAELGELELAFPVHGYDRRRKTSIFRDSDSKLLTGSNMDRLMSAALEAIGISTKYSWHGYRASLACSLLQAGRSNAEIMSLCRWQTKDSLLVYAQLDHVNYSEMLRQAYGRDISTIQPSERPVVARVLSEQSVAQELRGYEIPRTLDDK